jgi:hypothetical protein
VGRAGATPIRDRRWTFVWGCLLARLDSARHRYASRTAQEWLLRLLSARPDLPGLPQDLDTVIHAAFAHDPRDRHTAGDLAAINQTRREEYPPARRWRRPEAGATP